MHIPVELPPCDCIPQYLAVLHIKSHPAPPPLSSLYTASVWQPSTLHFQRPMPAVAHYILRAQSIFKKNPAPRTKQSVQWWNLTVGSHLHLLVCHRILHSGCSQKKVYSSTAFLKVSMCTGIGLCPKVTALGQVVNTALLWQGRVYICQSVFFFTLGCSSRLW